MNCKQKDVHEWDFVSGDDGDIVVAQNTANIMDVIQKHDVYFQCNLHVPSSTSSVPESISRVIDLRRTLANTEELWEHAKGAGIQNPSHSTLWLIGSKGCGSGFHVTWAEAYNIAWRIDENVCVLCSEKVPTICNMYMMLKYIMSTMLWVCAWRA